MPARILKSCSIPCSSVSLSTSPRLVSLFTMFMCTCSKQYATPHPRADMRPLMRGVVSSTTAEMGTTSQQRTTLLGVSPPDPTSHEENGPVNLGKILGLPLNVFHAPIRLQVCDICGHYVATTRNLCYCTLRTFIGLILRLAEIALSSRHRRLRMWWLSMRAFL